MKIELQLNLRQLDVLLCAIERSLNVDMDTRGMFRGAHFAEAALRTPPHDFSYDNAQLAPVYLQLTKSWSVTRTPVAGGKHPDWQRAWACRQSAEVSHV